LRIYGIKIKISQATKNIPSDCIAVLHWIGYIKPELIEDYIFDFLKLLHSKNNRLVWGAMIILSTIANRKPKEIFDNLADIVKAIDNGSVITIDNGIKTLATVASVNENYNKAIFPFLIKRLKTCRPKDVPQYSESIFAAVNLKNKNEYVDVLNERKDILTPSQLSRIRKIFKLLENIK
jgi:hypothetical protein